MPHAFPVLPFAALFQNHITTTNICNNNAIVKKMGLTLSTMEDFLRLLTLFSKHIVLKVHSAKNGRNSSLHPS